MTSTVGAIESKGTRMDKLTEILKAASASGRPLATELLPLVYDELRTLATHRMNQEGPGQTLQATALVHEAWMRLTKDQEREWNDKAHFFRSAAQAMRHILVDRARAKMTQKRGAGQAPLDIHGLEVADASQDERTLLVDEALKELETTDPDSARIISLKFFGGLTNEEVAKMEEISLRSVERQWAYARGRLYQIICGEDY